MTPAQNSHARNMALVSSTGGTKGYTPLPPDQHAWPLVRKIRNKLRLPYVVVLWSWMVEHTYRYPYNSPYPVDVNGNDLFLDDFAEFARIDPANARRAWRHGESVGLWQRSEKVGRQFRM